MDTNETQLVLIGLNFVVEWLFRQELLQISASAMRSEHVAEFGAKHFKTAHRGLDRLVLLERSGQRQGGCQGNPRQAKDQNGRCRNGGQNGCDVFHGSEEEKGRITRHPQDPLLSSELTLRFAVNLPMVSGDISVKASLVRFGSALISHRCCLHQPFVAERIELCPETTDLYRFAC